MKVKTWLFVLCGILLLLPSAAAAADTVPAVIEQPGTQPGEVGNLESPDKCDNCHGGYNSAVEPAFNWRGSMMGNAGRDPIFWATLAIAEQDFDGSGDLCIRCHSTGGWQAGRSTPTDGSGLAAADDDGVDCDACHKMTNPDNSEFFGEMYPPFIANDPATGEAYLGSGMISLWGGADKLGPYGDAEARHRFQKSDFHRSITFCGSCHDVSNPAVGNLAHNNGTQETADPVVSDGSLDLPLDTKAAFSNLPYTYGIVERTFSEYMSGGISGTPVSGFPGLPADLQAGALQAGYESALVAGTGGNYEDGSERFFSCQTCHMRPVSGPGCNKKGVPSRNDMPLHDMTGGNYWVGEIIKYQDARGQLRLGGDLTAVQTAAIDAGAVRAKKQLSEAASLLVEGDTLKVVNLTGHKLITGYPEGRRMWLNIRWFDTAGELVGEDGAYGPLADSQGNAVTVTDPSTGAVVQVKSILELENPFTKIYEAHYGMTKEWADQLLGLGYATDLPLSFDRHSGLVDFTLGDLAALPGGSSHETFHFVMNNTVLKDNRIPPYGFDYEKARVRNALPVPAGQYGYPNQTGVYSYFDEISLSPPDGAVYASIDLLYQGTSWEYIQFLWLANDGRNPFLADEGVNLLGAWLNTGMAEPYVMASTTWGNAPTPAIPAMFPSDLTTFAAGRKGVETVTDTFSSGGTVNIRATVVDEYGTALSGVQLFMDVADGGGATATSLQGFTDDSGTAVLKWKTARREPSGLYTGTVSNLIKSGYLFNAAAGVNEVTFTIQ